MPKLIWSEEKTTFPTLSLRCWHPMFWITKCDTENARPNEETNLKLCQEKSEMSPPIWGQFYQRVYAQLLRPQIPKSAHSCLTWLSFLAVLGSAHVKAAHKGWWNWPRQSPNTNFLRRHFFPLFKTEIFDIDFYIILLPCDWSSTGNV